MDKKFKEALFEHWNKDAKAERFEIDDKVRIISEDNDVEGVRKLHNMETVVTDVYFGPFGLKYVLEGVEPYHLSGYLLKRIEGV